MQLTKIAFTKHRKKWYLISMMVIVAGLLSMMLQGLHFGIDFSGGNMMELEFTNDPGINSLRTHMEDQSISYNVQKSGDDRYILRTEELDEKLASELLGGIRDEYGEVTLQRDEKVSASIGEELTRNALMALGIAAILMIAYITFRFEFYFGIAAVLALLHDVLITVGIFSIFQIEINSAFVAALLTIIGYSINDTIVIFDRIRENSNRKSKMGILEIVDVSINQTLFRSITTTAALLLVLLSLFFLGGNTIRDFVLAMLIGSISGVYSSIFVASPLWIDLTFIKRKKS